MSSDNLVKQEVDEGEKGEEEEEGKKVDLTVDQKAKVEEYFGLFDKAGEGYISLGDSTFLMRALGCNPTEGDLTDLYKKDELDVKGQVKLSDMYRLMSDMYKSTDTMEELIESMKIFDDDLDGKIATNEFRYALTQLGEKFTEEDVDQIVNVADKDQSGLVSIQEFGEYLFKDKDKYK